MTAHSTDSTVYLVGGGIASLAAAVFLIRDAGLDGSRIRILEESSAVGGSLDGATSAFGGGYVTRGGRMLEEEAYTCLWDLLESIPTLTDPAVSVREEIRAFNQKWPTDAKARLIDGEHRILDASDLGLSAHDRAQLAHLLALSEHAIGDRRIDEFFSEHFFASNFWTMWRTTFAFQNWHSAIELKRYLLRFAQELPRIHTLAGVRRTRLNQYESIVRPVQSWLTCLGVGFEYGTKVTDVHFADTDTDPDTDTGRRAVRIDFTRRGQQDSYHLGADDYALVTLGSMTSDATFGDDEHAPGLARKRHDGAFALWETIAAGYRDFGCPAAFTSDVDASKWESFTVTMRSPLLLHRIEEFSGNLPGTGALMTFRDSPWLLSVVVPHQPHFAGQDEDVYTLWGYGLFPDEKGRYLPKAMSEATGQEILAELLGQLGCYDDLDELRADTTVVPVMMPYITSQFAPRGEADRPKVIPDGAQNFAFLGQFVEIPEDVVFTVEYSVRGAMLAVYGLFDVDRKIPGIYHAAIHPGAALRTLVAALG